MSKKSKDPETAVPIPLVSSSQQQTPPSYALAAAEEPYVQPTTERAPPSYYSIFPPRAPARRHASKSRRELDAEYEAPKWMDWLYGINMILMFLFGIAAICFGQIFRDDLSDDFDDSTCAGDYIDGASRGNYHHDCVQLYLSGTLMVVAGAMSIGFVFTPLLYSLWSFFIIGLRQQTIYALNVAITIAMAALYLSASIILFTNRAFSHPSQMYGAANASFLKAIPIIQLCAFICVGSQAVMLAYMAFMINKRMVEAEREHESRVA